MMKVDPKTKVEVVSIHDLQNGFRFLAFDLKDILKELDDYLGRWYWQVTVLDAYGDSEPARTRVEKTCEQVDRADDKGVSLSSGEMTALATDINQTIDGTFLAIPRAIDSSMLDKSDISLAAFPNNRAELAIRAVDSTYWEVYVKDPTIPARLRKRFHDVRQHGPVLYFAHPYLE